MKFTNNMTKGNETMNDLIMTKTMVDGTVKRTYVDSPSEIWFLGEVFKIYFGAPNENAGIQFMPFGGKIEFQLADEA